MPVSVSTEEVEYFFFSTGMPPNISGTGASRFHAMTAVLWIAICVGFSDTNPN